MHLALGVFRLSGQNYFSIHKNWYSPCANWHPSSEFWLVVVDQVVMTAENAWTQWRATTWRRTTGSPSQAWAPREADSMSLSYTANFTPVEGLTGALSCRPSSALTLRNRSGLMWRVWGMCDPIVVGDGEKFCTNKTTGNKVVYLA